MTNMNDIHPLQTVTELRLLAAALELQHLTSMAANLVMIPGGERVIAIGTPAKVRELLDVAPGSASPAAAGLTDEQAARDLADAIMDNLDDRSGILDGVDSDILEEIHDEMVATIKRSHLAAPSRDDVRNAARQDAMEEAAAFLEMQTGYTETEAATVSISCKLIRMLKRRPAGWGAAPAAAQSVGDAEKGGDHG